MTAHYRRPVKAPRREIASKFDFQEFGSKGQSRLVGVGFVECKELPRASLLDSASDPLAQRFRNFKRL